MGSGRNGSGLDESAAAQASAWLGWVTRIVEGRSRPGGLLPLANYFAFI